MIAFFIKRKVSRALGRLCDLDGFIKGRGKRYVMAYHRVIPAGEANAGAVHSSLWISPRTFLAQLQWMQTVGTIVDHRTIADFTTENDRPWFALTFDDGWRDNYDVAFDLLKREGAPATVFLVSGAMDADALFWPQDVATKTKHAVEAGRTTAVAAALAACAASLSAPGDGRPVAREVERLIEVLKRQPPVRRDQLVKTYLDRIGADPAPLRGYLLSWQNARDMMRQGIAFGSHTHTHEILEGLPAERAEHECVLSRAIIAERLQCDVDAFCYPNARFGGDEPAMLDRAGYSMAFCMDGRRVRSDSERFYLPRFLVSEATASQPDYFRLHLLEAPIYAARRYRPLEPGRRWRPASA